ncbi:MAG: hypothetical protein AAF633_22750 [Chloroflexota bacterium]
MSDETVYKAQEKSLVASRRSRPALVAIGAGVGLLALTLSGFSILALIQPLVILGGIGALFALPAYRSTPNRVSNWSFLASISGFFIALGSTIVVLDLINHEEAFAYLWTILPIGFTAGLMYARRHQPGHPIHSNGEKVIRLFAIIGVVLGIFLELFVFNTLGPWWPLLLVGYGIYLIAKRK